MVLPLRVPQPGTPIKSPALPGVGSAFRRPSPKGARRIIGEVEAVRAASPVAFKPQKLRVVSPTARVAWASDLSTLPSSQRSPLREPRAASSCALRRRRRVIFRPPSRAV